MSCWTLSKVAVLYIPTLDTLNDQLDTAKSELGKPFPQEEELQSKLSRLSELNSLLNIDGNAAENADIVAEKKKDTDISAENKDDGPADSDRKPSILDKIKNIKAEQNSKDAPKVPTKSKDEEISWWSSPKVLPEIFHMLCGKSSA